jgi:hypothetical protein
MGVLSDSLIIARLSSPRKGRAEQKFSNKFFVPDWSIPKALLNLENGEFR